MSLSFSRMNPNEMCEPNLGMEEEAWLGQGAQKQNQELKMKPHAQAHLLSPTDKCKVYPDEDQFIVLCHFGSPDLHDRI